MLGAKLAAINTRIRRPGMAKPVSCTRKIENAVHRRLATSLVYKSTVFKYFTSDGRWRSL